MGTLCSEVWYLIQKVLRFASFRFVSLRFASCCFVFEYLSCVWLRYSSLLVMCILCVLLFYTFQIRCMCFNDLTVVLLFPVVVVRFRDAFLEVIKNAAADFVRVPPIPDPDRPNHLPPSLPAHHSRGGRQEHYHVPPEHHRLPRRRLRLW